LRLKLKRIGRIQRLELKGLRASENPVKGRQINILQMQGNGVGEFLGNLPIPFHPMGECAMKEREAIGISLAVASEKFQGVIFLFWVGGSVVWLCVAEAFLLDR